MKPPEIHNLLKERHFAIGPWLFRVVIMCISFGGLGYYKYQLMKKNNESKKPQFTIPATRPSK